MLNQLFIPTIAKFKDDITKSLEISKSLIEKEYNSGLMLVVLGGLKGIIEDAEKQYFNLREFKEIYGDTPIVTMLSNMPIKEIDFLNNTEFTKEHVKKGIDFTKELPIGGKRILTFHLNSLVSKKEFVSKIEEEWKKQFQEIIFPVLREIANYAKSKEVEVKIETSPVPEFGDFPNNDERIYRGVKLNNLRNPFYLTHIWGFEQIRASGLGICLDLCHNKTIYSLVKIGDPENLLHSSDRELLKDKGLLEDVLALSSSDLVHLNDGKGLYSEKNKTLFEEGICLGEGEIKDLRKIINHLNFNKIPCVLEINEENYATRSNTKKSIKYLLNNG